MLAEADHLSPEQREHLLAHCDSLPAANREGVVAALASSWARTESAKAAAWALAHGQADDGASVANSAAQQVFLRWVNNDADAALAWWRVLTASQLHDALGTNASTFLAENGQIDAAMELFHPRANPAGAWYVRDPEAVARWVETLPAGAARDQATRVFIEKAAAASPVSAAEWVETVADPALHQKAAEWVFWKT